MKRARSLQLMTVPLRVPCVLLMAFLAPTACNLAHGQVTLASAINLAVHNSPRVQLAQSDVARARAALQEVRDAYIPNLSVGGSGYGKSYGFPLGQPTALAIQSQSLVFSFSQRDYLRSTRASLEAANFSLIEARQVVAEDTINTYIGLDRDELRLNALREQEAHAARLVEIVRDRLQAGKDTNSDLTSARLTLAQVHLRVLQAEDDQVVDQAHLAHLTALPFAGLTTSPDSIPAIPLVSPEAAALGRAPTPGIDALFANARAKREQAFGDARYLFRPQVTFAAQYSLISTFSNSNYQEYFGRRDQFGNLLPFPPYAIGVGVQVSVPLMDFAHRARARQSAAEAVHAERDATQQEDTFTEGRLRTQRSVVELAARADIASLDQQVAVQQLAVLAVQLQSTASGGSPMTPKDEQNARITERDKFLTLIDATFQLRQNEINLLRQTGGLDKWVDDLTTGRLPAASQPIGATLDASGSVQLPPPPMAAPELR